MQDLYRSDNKHSWNNILNINTTVLFKIDKQRLSILYYLFSLFENNFMLIWKFSLN